jgi:hypothetical protein
MHWIILQNERTHLMHKLLGMPFYVAKMHLPFTQNLVNLVNHETICGVWLCSRGSEVQAAKPLWGEAMVL